MRWALAHGVAKVRGYSHLYVSEGDADKIAQLDQLAAGTGALDFFCINDTTDDAHLFDPRLMKVRETLQGMFATTSRFEFASLQKVPSGKVKQQARPMLQLELQSTS